MVDYYVDLSLGINGTGTAGSPWNTFAGMIVANEDRVWIRRTGTPSPFTGTITLTTVGVELIGWPFPGEYGYDERSLALPAWDADVHVSWVISLVGNTTALVLTSAPNTYVSKLRVVFTSVGSVNPILLGHYCTLDTVEVTNAHATTGLRFITVQGTASKILNPSYLQTAGAQFGGRLTTVAGTESPAIWMINSRNECASTPTTFQILNIVNNGINVERGSILDIYTTGIGDIPLTQGTISYTPAQSIGPGYSILKFDINSAITTLVHMQGTSSSDAGSSHIYNRCFMKARNLTVHGNTNYTSSFLNTYSIITDRLTEFTPTNSVVTIYPFTTATEIMPTTAANLDFGRQTHTMFNKVIAPHATTSANVAWGSTSFRDGSNIWSSVSRLGESSSSEVFRVGGATFSVSTEITSVASLGTTGAVNGTTPAEFPVLVGADSGEVIRVSLIPGLYELRLYGTDTVFTYNDPRVTRVVTVEYCNRFGPTCQVLTTAEPDSSTWTGIGPSSGWVYKCTIETDDPIDVFVRMIYMDVYAQDRVSFLDPLPEIINLEI